MPQLKGFAEAANVEIEVVDASRLEATPQIYSPTPEHYSPANSYEMSPVTRFSRILLFREHYYPLVEKGSFPNHKLGPEKTGVQHYGEWQKDFELHEKSRDFGNQVNTASLSYPPIIPISPSNGQTQIEEDTPAPRRN